MSIRKIKRSLTGSKLGISVPPSRNTSRVSIYGTEVSPEQKKLTQEREDFNKTVRSDLKKAKNKLMVKSFHRMYVDLVKNMRDDLHKSKIPETISSRN